MLKDIFSQIWANLYVRIALVLVALLMLFAIIASGRMGIYNFWDRIWRGAAFDNPYSWQGDIYGFTEQPEAALRLYRSGLEDLLELALDTYDNDADPDDLINENIDIDAKWQTHLKPAAVEQLHVFFKDMAMFCQPMIDDFSASYRWQRSEKLKKRQLRVQDKKKPNPFDFAISEKNYPDLAEDLYDLDWDYFALSLQKKPDAWAPISLREKVLSSNCKPVRAIDSWQKSLDYMEYKTEKALLFAGDKQKEILPEALADAVFNELRDNKYYHALLKEFFLRSYHATANLDWKLQASRNSFALTRGKGYLNAYVKAMLQLSRLTGPVQNQEIFDQLFNIKFGGLESRSDYVYALAETAFRARNFKKARALVNQISRQGIYSDRYQKKMARRLGFIISLLGH